MLVCHPATLPPSQQCSDSLCGCTHHPPPRPPPAAHHPVVQPVLTSPYYRAQSAMVGEGVKGGCGTTQEMGEDLHTAQPGETSPVISVTLPYTPSAYTASRTSNSSNSSTNLSTRSSSPSSNPSLTSSYAPPPPSNLTATFTPPKRLSSVELFHRATEIRRSLRTSNIPTGHND